MAGLARGVILCFVVSFWKAYFCYGGIGKARDYLFCRLARREIICYVVCFWTVYFCYGRIVGTGACEWDLEDGNFFHRDCMIHMIIFFTLTWKNGQGERLFDL